MSAFLSPAIRVMNRLSVQGKLALLGLIALAPVVVLAFMRSWISSLIACDACRRVSRVGWLAATTIASKS